MNDGIKLSAQTSFMEKGTVQRKEKQHKRNYNQLWVAQTFPKKLSTDNPRGQWLLGRVVEVTEGDDEFVRFVKVQVGGSVVIRSITKIYPLEVNESNQNITPVRHGGTE